MNENDAVTWTVADLKTSAARIAVSEDLMGDGDECELADGRFVRLRIEQDSDASINDYDSDGRVEWTRDNDYGPVRPSDFSGAARIIDRERGETLWWEPYEGLATDEIERDLPRITRLVREGFSAVGIELFETVADSLGGEHDVLVVAEWIGGIDELYPGLVPELLNEMAHRVDGRRD